MDKSFANGNGPSTCNGTTGARSWRSGWQAPPPPTIWDFLEGRDPE